MRAGALATSVVAGFLVLALATGRPTVAGVDSTSVAIAERKGDWSSYGRTPEEQYFSPLTEINAANVSNLGLAWFLDLPGERTLEATPLAVEGVLYFSGTYGRTFAVDARTGKLRWTFDPQSGLARPDAFRFSGSFGAHRGVAYWRGRIYLGAVDGRLFALDAKSGKVLWNVQTFDDPKARRAISGAPRVVKDMVVIGHSAFSGAAGYVTAYDAGSGRQRWRFYTVPDPSSAQGRKGDALHERNATWEEGALRWGGNGSVWNSIVYDAEFDRLYFGTANWAQPGFTADFSRRDHLFTSSIVAVDADTGKYIWHYQENPRGDRDYDSAMPIVLADLKIAGAMRKVLLHAPKNGFFYVIDRRNGSLVSAEKLTKVTWAERINLQSGRPVEVKNPPGEVWPSYLGAHSWQPMAFNPNTGLVYIPVMKLSMSVTRIDADDGTAKLVAWDPVTQQKRWDVHYANSFWNGGTMSTAGNLVFQGTGRGELIAYRADNGRRLWSFNAGLGIIAAPMTYVVDGVQYISVLVGYGGGANGVLGTLADYGWRFNEQPRRLLTFALGKTTPLPASAPPRYDVKALDDPALVIDSAKATEGSQLYAAWMCSVCHGPELRNTGSFAPDLRESGLALSFEGFRSVLRDGVLAPLGMPKFDDLNDDQIRALHQYVRQQARSAHQSVR